MSRSHAERTEETRGKILAAVVESIGEVGFQRTTASEIAQRAGVTWGAVQHHFGGKDGILQAVLEDSFERFEARISGIDPENLSLEKRVHEFVDRAWQHFASAHYRSTFEILLHYGSSDEPDRTWPDDMYAAWDRVWKRLFSDARLPRRREVALQQYTIAVLSGLASAEMLDRRSASVRGPELQLLQDTLVRELG